MSTFGTVVTPTTNTVFLTYNALVLGTETAGPPTPGDYVGRFRFLKDHFVYGEYILAGEIRDMVGPWTPTADVEPLDSVGVNSFYAMGPRLPGVWRTHYSNRIITRPVTYWRAVAPNVWGLTGLGSTKATVSALLSRVEDKEP